MTSAANGIPIVQIHRGNWEELQGMLKEAISNAAFVAFDLELSGIGNPRDLSLWDLDHRYEKICEVADSRSVLSLGLSFVRFLTSHEIFPQNEPKEGDVPHYSRTFLAQNFDILCSCQDPFVTDPKAADFLIRNGFDFNRQLAFG
ncbi:unnamed protein product, partial [Notodromas monacha]